MNTSKITTCTLAFLVAFLPGRVAWADPCGMVPPIWLGDGSPIVRVGDQKTFVFHRNGIETLVLRPGFSGKVDEFGMLIPFPTPPAIRKVDDDIFTHVAAAIDPPEVLVDLRWIDSPMACDAVGGARKSSREGALSVVMERDEVRVLSEEAVGMYQVAVLEAGVGRRAETLDGRPRFRVSDRHGRHHQRIRRGRLVLRRGEGPRRREVRRRAPSRHA